MAGGLERSRNPFTPLRGSGWGSADRDQRIEIPGPDRLKAQPGQQTAAMARFRRSTRQRLRGRLRPGEVPPEGRPWISWGVVVAIGLLLAGVPMLFFNQKHSGDPLKIRRELRKF